MYVILMLGSYSLDLYICLGLFWVHYIEASEINNKAANTIPQLNGATYK